MRFQNGVLCVALMAMTSIAVDETVEELPAKFNGKCFQCLSKSFQWCADSKLCIGADELECAGGKETITGLTACGEPPAPEEGFSCPPSTVLKDDATYPVIVSGEPIESNPFLKDMITMGPG